MNTNIMLMTDGYKVDHRRQYPPGTESVYSTFTPRASRIPGTDKVVFFGLQYFLQRYLTELAWETFFSRPKDVVINEYKRHIDAYLGPNDVGTAHIAALHDLGYVPLRFSAVPEGTRVPLRVPMFVMENTLPEFYWVTNYFETLLSSVLWLPCTSATTAYRYKRLFDEYADKTTVNGRDFTPWQGHDFSFRGMASPEAAALSGAGHLLSFSGTDTIPAIDLLNRYYGGAGIAGSVPATEHSVMCAGGEGNELETISRLLDLYPTGIVSVVCDTWDLWNVVDNILPKLKDKIMSRNGKLVIRPDSGDPANILCGDPDKPLNSTQGKGLVKRLDEIFGHNPAAKGFKELDPHIGCIYGDSITEARAADIMDRLYYKGYASTSVVLGIGSFTYQYTTRDAYGFAVKATSVTINGKEQLIYKDPKTDSGEKKSAKGRIVVLGRENGLMALDGYAKEAEALFGDVNMLRPVWEDGEFVRKWTTSQIRERVSSH